MRPVLLHYHILKNGGSTIIEMLARSFWETFEAFDLPDLDAEITPRDLLSFLESNPRVQAFSSHQIFYPIPRAPGYLFFDICFLRDPIDRIRSIYDYFRAKPVEGETMSGLAYRRTLGEFTRRLVEEMPWTVNDVQVNLLANGLVHDQPRGIEDLAVATARMLETSFLGVVDRFDESLVVGQYDLSLLFPALNCVHAPVNASATPGTTLAERTEQFKRACDDGVYAELLRLNAMDFELLRRARAEVRRRFDLVPDREERLRGLQEGVSILQARRENENGSTSTSETVPPPETSIKRRARSTLTPRTPAPGVFTRLMSWLRFVRNLRMMRPGSAFRRLFDANYYSDAYPDVAASGLNPFWHFVLTGAFEGRNPHPLFDTTFYLSQCPRPPAINALGDYLERGDAAGRRPHPLFDPEYYTRRYPDVRQARMNSLLHYVLHGAAEGRKPNPLFQPDYYLTVCAAARNGGNPLLHFAECEAAECGNPHPLFDCKFYLRAHPETTGNPLVHYLTHHPDSLSPCEAGPGTFDTARFTIQEVEVLAVLPESGFDVCAEATQRRIYNTLQACAARDGCSGEIALIWQDTSGRKKVLCAPQQQPFFECLRYDQLVAQINGTLVVGQAPALPLDTR
jgi:hypothetical protein